MQSFSLVLLFVASSSAFRKSRSKPSAAFSVNTSEALERCGSCTALEDYLWGEAWSLTSKIGASDTAVGHEGGVCCRTRNRYGTGPTDMYSASKMITAYTILKLVDEGLLSLETKAADIFDYWTATDGRKDVTIRHLLSQTSGVRRYPLGLAMCTDGLISDNGTKLCAKQAYDDCFPESFTPGTEFYYTETAFYIVSAMVLEVTGLRYWDDVFQTYLAGPLGINSDSCQFSEPSFARAFAGGGLKCDTENYVKILQAILGKTLFKDITLYDEAERPHTLDAPPACGPSCIVGDCPCPSSGPAGVVWHYGLGQWTECATPRCEGGILRTSSAGKMGSYPWVDRGGLTGNAPHWGLMVRFWPITSESGRQGIIQIQESVLPLAAAAVQ